MAIEKDLLDRLLADYKKPEDLIGETLVTQTTHQGFFWSELWKLN